MTYRIFIFFLIAFLGINSGCHDFSPLDDLDVPMHQSKLVVFAHLRASKDSVQGIYVGKTRNALDTANGFVRRADSIFQNGMLSIYGSSGLDTVNATVELFKNNQLFATLTRDSSYQTNLNYYFLGTKLEADGATYALRISATGFKTIESQQVMPPLGALDSVKFIRKGWIYKDLNVYPEAYEFLYFLRDSIANPNYYYATGRNQLGWHYEFFNNDPTINSNILSDRNFSGKSFIWRVFYQNREKFGLRNVYFQLNSTTRDAYLFNQSSSLYFEAHNNKFAEPTTLYSNIKNGYGIFTLSAVSEFYLKF